LGAFNLQMGILWHLKIAVNNVICDEKNVDQQQFNFLIESNVYNDQESI
tara:strand:+ start:30 stop:176 length:147 start_codon:yes stop_codon:yes gene_type:complete